MEITCKRDTEAYRDVTVSDYKINIGKVIPFKLPLPSSTFSSVRHVPLHNTTHYLEVLVVAPMLLFN